MYILPEQLTISLSDCRVNTSLRATIVNDQATYDYMRAFKIKHFSVSEIVRMFYSLDLHVCTLQCRCIWSQIDTHQSRIGRTRHFLRLRTWTRTRTKSALRTNSCPTFCHVNFSTRGSSENAFRDIKNFIKERVGMFVNDLFIYRNSKSNLEMIFYRQMNLQRIFGLLSHPKSRNKFV